MNKLLINNRMAVAVVDYECVMMIDFRRFKFLFRLFGEKSFSISTVIHFACVFLMQKIKQVGLC